VYVNPLFANYMGNSLIDMFENFIFLFLDLKK